MLVISIILTLVSVFFFKNKIHSFALRITIASVVFLIFLSSGLWWISNYFTGQGVNESVIYLLKSNFTDAGFGDFKLYIFLSIIYIITTLLISCFSFKLIKKQILKKNNSKVFLSLLLLIFAIIINPISEDFYFIIKKNIYKNKLNIPENFVQFNLKNSSKKLNGKNIVYIYLESLEATYMDTTIFPQLTPNISAYYKNSLAFNNILQTYGDGWTIAGIVSSQCGMPLLGSASNSMSDIDLFLPGAKCLGDVLANNGYNLEYYGGASLNFGGKDKFLTQHGFHSVYGKEKLINKINDKNYQNNWGLYDDSLLNLVVKRFDELNNKDKPFGLFALTLDTHHPNGSLSNSCKNIKYLDGSNPILNAVHCVDKLIFDFIEKIKTLDKNNNTIIIVTSDHLAMTNSAKKMLDKGSRKNLFFILNSDSPNKIINKPGSLIDVAPTLLSLLGISNSKFAFGRSLLNKEPTLVEIQPDTRDFIKHNIETNSRFVSGIWNFPNIKNGISISSKKKKIKFGDRYINYPALLVINDKNLFTEKVIFDAYSPKRIPQHLANFEFGQKFIWVDSCLRIRVFQPETLDSKGDCIAYGSLGFNNIKTLKVNNYLEINYKKFLTVFNSNSNSKIDQIIDKKKYKDQLSFIADYGIYAHNFHKKNNNLFGKYLLKSSGDKNNNSNEIINLDSGLKLNVKRHGLNLIGLNKDGPPILIRNIDLCKKSISSEYPDQYLDNNYSFQGEIIKFKNYFGGFVVIANNLGACEIELDLNNLLADTGLKKLQNKGLRNRYIGIISGENLKSEFFSEDTKDLLIYSLNFLSSNLSTEKQQIKDYLPTVAHGGGGYQGRTYSNSIDALNANYNSYDLFEIDFSWTSDNHLVCIHDWKGRFKSVFSKDYEGPISLEEFNELNKKKINEKKCTIYSLTEWLRINPNAIIVTDIKRRNIEALKLIKNKFPELQKRFIPQIHKPIEYFHARSLGFKDIIWALYSYRENNEKILQRLKLMNLYGLAIPKSRAYSELAAKAYNTSGVLSWAHTINSEDEFKELKRSGINQIYTTFLKSTKP